MFLEPYEITIDKNASFASYIWIRGVVGTLKFTRVPQDWEFESMENFFELLNCSFRPKDGLDLLDFRGRKT